MRNLNFLDKYKDYAPIVLRLVVGSFLIYGAQDNVFSYERMVEFEKFLGERGVPFPLFAAFLSVYAQFVCGALLLVGAATRYAAAVMIINFVAALVIAHRGDDFRGMFPALVILAASCFFFLNGTGKPSVDDALEKRRKNDGAGAP